MDFASGRDCGRRDRHPALPGRCVHPGRRDRYRGPFPLRPGGARVMDAAGKLITPGFINMHSHSDCSAAMYPNMESTLGQDITTEFAGHCGLGVAPVQDNWLYMFPEKRAFTKVMPEPPGAASSPPTPAAGACPITAILRTSWMACGNFWIWDGRVVPVSMSVTFKAATPSPRHTTV